MASKNIIQGIRAEFGNAAQIAFVKKQQPILEGKQPAGYIEQVDCDDTDDSAWWIIMECPRCQKQQRKEENEVMIITFKCCGLMFEYNDEKEKVFVKQ